MERRTLAIATCGALAALGGAFNLLGTPHEEREGYLGPLLDLREAVEWVVDATLVSSVALVLLGVAVVLLALREEG